MIGIRSYSISGIRQETPLNTSTTESTATVQSDGDYMFWCDTVDCYIYVGAVNDASVTVENGIVLYTGSSSLPINLKKGSVIRAITASGTGKLRYAKIGVIR